MKHPIYPEKTGIPTATSADVNYPVTNLTDNGYRKKVWKAASGVQSATLRVPISADAEAIALVNTNAETAICTITLDSNEQNLNNAAAVDEGGGLVGIPITTHGYIAGNIILINDSVNYDGVHTLPAQTLGTASEIIITATYVAETFAGTETACIVVETETHTLETASRTYDSFWQEYTSQATAHTATIKLTAATGETVEAGIVRAGEILTLANPQYGANEVPVDYSIKKQLRNGAYYGKKLEKVRSFSYSMDLPRETKYRDLMDLYEYYRTVNPFMVLIDDEVDDNMWVVFACFQSEPSVSHSYPSDSVANVSLVEVV